LRRFVTNSNSRLEREFFLRGTLLKYKAVAHQKIQDRTGSYAEDLCGEKVEAEMLDKKPHKKEIPQNRNGFLLVTQQEQVGLGKLLYIDNG
jgi:hypothetical protein